MENANQSQPKDLPKDSHVIIAMMKELGITEYDPMAVVQLSNFVYRYATSVMQEAKMYAKNTDQTAKSLELNEMKLALQFTADSTFTPPPPRDLVLECASDKNSSALPKVNPHFGLRLPPARYCLVSSNFALKSAQDMPLPKPSFTQGPALKMSTKSNISFVKKLPTVGTPQNIVIPKPKMKIVAKSESIILKPKMKIVSKPEPTALKQMKIVGQSEPTFLKPKMKIVAKPEPTALKQMKIVGQSEPTVLKPKMKIVSKPEPTALKQMKIVGQSEPTVLKPKMKIVSKPESMVFKPNMKIVAQSEPKMKIISQPAPTGLKTNMQIVSKLAPTVFNPKIQVTQNIRLVSGSSFRLISGSLKRKRQDDNMMDIS